MSTETKNNIVKVIHDLLHPELNHKNWFKMYYNKTYHYVHDLSLSVCED